MKYRAQSRLWAGFVGWLSKHKLAAWLIAGAVLISGGSILTYNFLAPKPQPIVNSDTKTEPKPEPVKYYSPLTGSLVDNQDATKQLVTAIIIENSPSARPQSGLKKSGVVFEAIAEGGITRFLVLYQQEKPGLIGPVRSLRMYYIDWLTPFNPSVAHIGGSAAALSEIRNGNHRDIDQFFNPQAYWRATDRFAPHNVYTNFERLDALNKSKGYTSSDVKGFSRRDAKPAEEPQVTVININISSDLYNSSYDYDPETNTYKRKLGGVAHVDREDGQIQPSVVIALRVNERTVLEDGYRQSIDTIGTGKAVIFQDGNVYEVNWRKDSRDSQIKFIDSEGKDVALVRGQTWISAVPNDTGSVTWQ